MSSQNSFKKAYSFWGKYHQQLEQWIDPVQLSALYKKFEEPNAVYGDLTAQIGRLKNAAIKEHFSSTHTWVKDVYHQYKDNFYVSPLECKVCGYAASSYEEEYVNLIEIEPGCLPSRDGHNYPIYRTCQEVLASKKKARQAHKGGKCITCLTYGCIDSEIKNEK